jgi:hypothetical protein
MVSVKHFCKLNLLMHSQTYQLTTSNYMTNWSEKTLNYWMIVERYPKRMEWLVVQFPAVKSPLYLTKKTSQVVKCLICSTKKKST